MFWFNIAFFVCIFMYTSLDVYQLITIKFLKFWYVSFTFIEKICRGLHFTQTYVYVDVYLDTFTDK